MHKKALSLLIVIVVVSACNPTSDDPALPTLLPTRPIASETPTSEPTLSPTQGPTATPRVRPTLPPTWTLTPTLSPTPTATLIIPTRTPVVIPNTLPPACSTFDAVFAESDVQFNIGQAPRVAWTPVEGAELYRLILSGPGGAIINDQIYLRETTYTFEAGLFQAGQLYGWEVYPINAAGIQMCFAVGLELLPVQPRSPGG
ncbi:MAG: hypothetical protein RML73_08945 [Anaerolineae bacterium]|nr:hypothetical protein [Anaerolineae bacterium]